MNICIYPQIWQTYKNARCKSEVDISFFGLNRKKQPYKTCVTCRSKAKKQHAPLKRTDTDFVNGVAETKQVEPTPSDTEDKSTTAELDSTQSDEKYVVVLDVETNGLIKQRGATPTDRNL